MPEDSAVAPEPYLSVVIPAYNEERRLPKTLERVLAYLKALDQPGEVVVVDDGSTDQTVAVVSELAAHQSRVRLLAEPHRGKGAAVRAGMLAARGAIVLFSDADLATPIGEAARLCAAIDQGFDVAIGSREGAGARRYGEPAFRHIMGRVFNYVVRLLAVGGINDTQCGFKAFRREAAHAICRRLSLYGPDAPVVQGAMVTAFDVEVIFLARRLGLRLVEVPIEWHYGRESKVDPLRDSWRNFRDVVRVRLNAWRGRYERD